MPTIPDSHSNRLSFFKNLKIQIKANAAALNWDSAKVDAVNALLDPIIAIYETLVAAEDVAAQASVNAAQLFTNNNKATNGLLDELRANPGLTDGMKKAMQLPDSKKVDPNKIKPRIKAKPEPGH